MYDRHPPRQQFKVLYLSTCAPVYSSVCVLFMFFLCVYVCACVRVCVCTCVYVCVCVPVCVPVCTMCVCMCVCVSLKSQFILHRPCIGEPEFNIYVPGYGHIHIYIHIHIDI
jgi:hypothetical protein